MRFSPPPFAGPDAPPPFAAVAAAAFGLATLAAAVASGSGPDAAEAFLARGDAHAALSILATSALPCAAAAAVALAGAAAKGAGASPPPGAAPGGLAARLRAMLRAAPRGRGAPGAAVSFLLFGAFVFAPALAILSAPVGLALEALGVEPEPQFAAKLFALPGAGPATRLALALSVTVLAPVAEEVLYRAILWQGLCAALQKRLSGNADAPHGRCLPGLGSPADAAAAALCALFFAALHASAWAFVPLAIFALALSAVYRRFSLGCAIALHAGFNAGGCALALLA